MKKTLFGSWFSAEELKQRWGRWEFHSPMHPLHRWMWERNMLSSRISQIFMDSAGQNTQNLGFDFGLWRKVYQCNVTWTFLPSPPQFSWRLLFYPYHLGHGSLSQFIQMFYISHPLLWPPIMAYFSSWPMDLLKHAHFLSSSQQISCLASQQISLPTIHVAEAFWSCMGTKIGLFILVLFLFLFSGICPASLKFICILWNTLS